MKVISLIAAALFCGSVMAAEYINNDFVVKIAPNMRDTTVASLKARLPQGSVVEDLGGQLRRAGPPAAELFQRLVQVLGRARQIDPEMPDDARQVAAGRFEEFQQPVFDLNIMMRVALAERRRQVQRLFARRVESLDERPWASDERQPSPATSPGAAHRALRRALPRVARRRSRRLRAPRGPERPGGRREAQLGRRPSKRGVLRRAPIQCWSGPGGTCRRARRPRRGSRSSRHRAR